MSSEMTLITCIATQGQADDIMSVARDAGARGGTILDARGTGTEDDVKFFGISMVPQKETILIVAENHEVDDIIKAICRMSIFSEPGSGIIYTTPVSRFINLGDDPTSYNS